jgi:O-antigen ligase
MTLSATVLRCAPVTAGLLDCQTARAADRAVVRGAAGMPAPPDPNDRRMWRAGIEMAKANPLLGEGPDGFRFSYWRYAPVESRATNARLGNVYLQVAAEVGLVGLAAMLWLATSVLWRLWVALHRCTSVGDRLLAGSLLGAFVSIVIQGSGVSYLSRTGLVFLMWILTGLAAALHVPAPQPAAQPGADTGAPPPPDATTG